MAPDHNEKWVEDAEPTPLIAMPWREFHRKNSCQKKLQKKTGPGPVFFLLYRLIPEVLRRALWIKFSLTCSS